MSNPKKILIITGGPKSKLADFLDTAKELNLDVKGASFSELTYFSKENKNKLVLRVGNYDVANFSLVYIRLVGKRLEDASLLVNYAKEHRVKLIDRLYENASMMPSSISKALELKHLIKGGINIPPTFFGSLKKIFETAGSLLRFPYVIKSTSGKKARDVWAPKSTEELKELIGELQHREKKGEKFFAQKLIKASQRVRVFVVGGKALGAVTRPTKWRKRWTEKVNGEYPKGRKGTLIPVPNKYAKIAVEAAKATYLDIAGVDILEEDKTSNLYIIEANAAPSWNLIKKYAEINVESEILNFLASKL